MSSLGPNKHTPVDATAGAVAMTLPTGAAAGTEISVEKYDSSANAVTITGSIRGVAAQTITLSLSKETVGFRADNSGSWWPVYGHKTLTSLDSRFASQTQLGTLAPLASPAFTGTPTVNGTPIGSGSGLTVVDL